MSHNQAYIAYKTFQLFSDDSIENDYKIEVEIHYNIESNAPEPGHSITDVEVVMSKVEEKSLLIDIYHDIECEILDNLEEYLGSAQSTLDDEESKEGEYKGDMEREGE